MTQTIERVGNVELESPDVGTLVDTFSAIQRMSGEQEIPFELLEEAENGIDSLVKRPEASFEDNANYMQEMYAARATVRELADGSKVTMWGTRDASKMFLDFKYAVLKRPDGTMRYDAVHVNGDGRMAYRLDGDTLDIAFTPRYMSTGGMSDSHPLSVCGTKAEAALRTLYDASIVAAASAKVRSLQAQASAHAHAAGFIVGNPVDRAVMEAYDHQSVENALNAYHR